MGSSSKTKIIATIGPATSSGDTIDQLIKAGMDIARINFSHGDTNQHDRLVKILQNRGVPVIADLSGPRLVNGETHHFDASSTSPLTEKDLADLELVVGQKVDYVALSYVSSKEDVLLLKEKIESLGGDQLVIAKIERKEALDNLEGIIEVSDGVMIARGDLGNEVALEKITFIEAQIIKRCNQLGKMVITATQMLLSMVDNPVPTRAEVTDVDFAVITGSDAVMLSEETAIGQYPVESVLMMEKIILEAEKHKNNE